MRTRRVFRLICGSKWVFISLAAAIALWGSGPNVVNAEVKEVRVAQQFGVNYLPLIVMKRHKLIEAHLEKAGLGQVKITWAQFGSGAAMNDALLSGSLDFASGGVGPLLTIWDRTKGEFDVKGVASLGSMPLYLVTGNPNVKSIRDFTKKDKIALPAVRVSIQAIVLRMAAAKAFGDGNFAQLDDITVSMRHPDAMAALLSGKTEITAHFANAPFQETALQNPAMRRVLSSYEVTDGPSTLNSVYATTKFREQNPKTYRALLAALTEAVSIINQDKKAAAQLYVEEERSKLSPDFVHKILADADFIVTVIPQGIMKYAEFMHRTKSIRNLPASWRDVYFPEIHTQPGS